MDRMDKDVDWQGLGHNGFPRTSLMGRPVCAASWRLLDGSAGTGPAGAGVSVLLRNGRMGRVSPHWAGKMGMRYGSS